MKARLVDPHGALYGTAMIEPGVAELVVVLLLGVVRKDVVRLLHFLELRLRIRFLADVRMVLAGKSAIDLLDLIGGSAALHAQGLIIVSKFHVSVSSASCMPCQ